MTIPTRDEIRANEIIESIIHNPDIPERIRAKVILRMFLRPDLIESKVEREKLESAINDPIALQCFIDDAKRKPISPNVDLTKIPPALRYPNAVNGISLIPRDELEKAKRSYR